MKCYACGAEYSGDICKICGFEKLYVAGHKTSSEVKEALEPFVLKHRQSFYPSVKVGIVLYKYDISESGAITETSENVIFRGLSLFDIGETVWLERSFDCATDTKKVTTQMFVEVAGRRVRDFSVTVPKIADAKSLYIGLRAERDTCVSVAVKDDRNTVLYSDPFPLFGG